MSDDPTDRGPQDRSRISLTQDHEVRYWTKALGVSAQDLEQAVEAAGNGADAVRAHLEGRRP